MRARRRRTIIVGMDGDSVGMTRRVRVLIADDKDSVRKSIRAVLQPDESVEVVGAASNGLEAVEMAARLVPDVILMDLAMPHLDGLEATRLIRDRKLPSIVIALATGTADISNQDVLASGVSAIIDKSEPGLNLTQLIHALCQSLCL